MELLEGCATLNDGLEVQATKNFPFKNISGLIYKHYGQHLSPNAIGKRLKRLGVLPRRGLTLHDEDEIKRTIELILHDLPETVGYRSMTNILRRKGMHVRRDMVMKAMRDVDLDGDAGFKDEYTDLSDQITFGMWMDMTKLSLLDLRSTDALTGCPMVLQTDPGSENIIMGGIQCVFRHDADDCFSGINLFRVSRSVFNQRIEAWWSLLRRRQTHSWIIMLKELEALGNFHRGNVIETYCLRYCLMPLIQRELDNIRDEWNSHHVSYSRQASCPNGRSDVLYSLSEDTGGKECLQQITEDCEEWALAECQFPSRSGSFEFDDLATNSFEENSEHDAFTWTEAIHNYNSLRNRLGLL